MAFATILPRARRSRERSNIVNSYGLRLGAGFISRARCMCSIRSQAVKARPGGGAWTSRRPTRRGGRYTTVRFDGYGVRVLPYSRVRLSRSSPARVGRACGDAVRRGVVAEQSEPGPAGQGGHKPQLATCRRGDVLCTPQSSAGTRRVRPGRGSAWVVRVRACRVFIRFKSPHRLTHRPAQLKNT